MKLLQLFNELSLHPKNAAELKGLILQLAVQGKLTAKWREENPDVEPASELIKRIEVEKERLVREKIIKKEKPLPTISAKENIEEIPGKWRKVRLGEIGDWGAGATPLRSNGLFYDGNNNWFKSGELNNGIIDYDSEEKITELALKKSSLRLNKPGDVLIAMYGATIGKTGILEVSGTTNQAVCACTPFSCISSEYLHLLLRALRKNFLSQGEGGAQPNISRIKIRNQIVSLPPLLEQQAIITTVNQLFAEVEQLEQLTKERIQLKHDFAASALQRLVQAGNINGEWAAVHQHFHTFFNEKFNVKKLRETILQLAVQGKLTTHWRQENPNTEPATELLKRITAEKQQLIQSGKIKKEKPLSPVKDDEIPFELPEGWVWCRLGEISKKLGAGSTPTGGKASYVDDGIKFFRSQNIYNDGIRINDIARITQKVHQRMIGTHIKPKDILLNITGGSIGRCALVPDEFDSGNVSQHVSIVRLVELELRQYIHKFFISPGFQERIMDVQVGVSREGLSMTKLKMFPTPLPPLQEQHAIVTTVNTLMGLCDALEQELGQQESRVEELMRSCVREVVEG